MANGQNVQPESGLDERPSMRDDSLDDVLIVIRKAIDGPTSKIPKDSPDYVPDRSTIAERLGDPEASAAILTLLNRVDVNGLDKLPVGARETVLVVIRAAVATGRSEFVPVLKRLAHNSNPRVRGVVADLEFHRRSPTPSVELMKECLMGALEYTPKEFVRSKDADQWVVDREPYERVENCMRLYCEFATQQQREDVRPLIENYLTKYSNDEFEMIYRPKLEKLLKIGKERLVLTQEEEVTSGLRPDKKSDRLTSSVIEKIEELYRSIPNFIWGGIVLLGVVWLARRWRKNSAA